MAEPFVTEALDFRDCLVPVDCTWEGREGTDGPWVFDDHIDRTAPILECDVHGQRAHGVVYDSDPECKGKYVGPCHYYRLPEVPASEGLDWTPQEVTDPCPDCGKQKDTFACKIKHVSVNYANLKGSR